MSLKSNIIARFVLHLKQNYKKYNIVSEYIGGQFGQTGGTLCRSIRFYFPAQNNPSSPSVAGRFSHYCQSERRCPPMDMDMDIPLPEELELLESNSQFYDDYLDLEPPEPYPEEDEHQPQPQLSLPTLSLDPPLLFEIHSNGQKRPRSDGADASTAENVGLSDEKRSRVDDVGSDSDEEWLRYSPPHRETNPDAEEQGRVTEEKIVSRYASHIDGDCIPVTSPSGDRVYAKICRVVGEERSKKLDMKEQSGGILLLL